MLWAALPVLCVVLASTSGTRAQSSDVTHCIPGYEWTYNSRNQSPCLVGAYLQSACTSQPIHVNAIPVGNHYIGPSFSQADPCNCNSVVYSLISACGGCQNRTFTSWGNWSLNCPAVEVATFPQPTPTAVEIPPWAFLNISQTNNSFDPVLAQRVASASEITSTTSSAPSATSVVPLYTPTTEIQASSHSSAGAIAGGVVGGIAFLAAVGLCVFWMFLRRRRGGFRKQHKNRGRVNLTEDDIPASPPPMHERSVTTPVSSDQTQVPQIFTQDFSSRPISPVTSGIYTTFEGRNSMDSFVYTSSQMTRGRYSGAAEI